jgi:sugar phosphate isomerase/epimerase
MQYGAMNFPVKPVLDELDDISAMGFDYLEMSMDPPRAHHSTLKKQKKEISEALTRYRMRVVCHLPTFLCLADLTESIRAASLKEISDSLETAAEFNALKVVLHPPYVTGLGVFVMNEVRAHAHAGLSKIVEKADSLGLTLCLENMFAKTHMLVEPDDFDRIFSLFPSLKFTLDTGHANIRSNSGRRILAFINRFSERLEHVHVSDNFGKEDSHLPIGAGTVDFAAIAKALKKIGYDKTVTFEIFSNDRNYLKMSRDKFASMVE